MPAWQLRSPSPPCAAGLPSCIVPTVYGLARTGPTLPCGQGATCRRARLGVAPARLWCLLPKDPPQWTRVWVAPATVRHGSRRAALGLDSQVVPAQKFQDRRPTHARRLSSRHPPHLRSTSAMHVIRPQYVRCPLQLH